MKDKIDYAGGYDIPNQQVQQMYVPQKKIATKEVKTNTFEQKAKDTVLFLGDNWGYGPLLIIILAGGIFRKKVMPWVVNPKKSIKDWLK